MARKTRSSDGFTNTPALTMNGDKAREISTAAGMVMRRGLFSANIKPIMSAPASAAASASAPFVTPQIFTFVLIRQRQHSTSRAKAQLRSAALENLWRNQPEEFGRGCFRDERGNDNPVGGGGWRDQSPTGRVEQIGAGLKLAAGRIQRPRNEDVGSRRSYGKLRRRGGDDFSDLRGPGADAGVRVNGGRGGLDGPESRRVRWINGHGAVISPAAGSHRIVNPLGHEFLGIVITCHARLQQNAAAESCHPVLRFASVSIAADVGRQAGTVATNDAHAGLM